MPEPAGGPDRRLRINIGGAVQGVGYRPFVWRIARDLGLSGWVSNGRAGVRVEAEGSSARLAALLDAVRARHPPHAAPTGVTAAWIAPAGSRGFTVRESDTGGPPVAGVLPDLATCPECLAEIRDAGGRRHRYPFTTCTQCGPRFSILTAIPWDRERTTMAGFPLCPGCRREYEDPADRRFHAEALACPVCGPRLELRDAAGRALSRDDEALQGAVAAIRAGRIVALKGLGGFQLIADARQGAALDRLRAAKHRRVKPLAVMFADLAALRLAGRPTAAEAGLLASAQAPIVLVRRRPDGGGLSPLVAPGNPYLGAMLPTTPLHHLLLGDLGCPVVATSGNRAEEPIVTDEEEAVVRLRGLAEVFLVHNRPIARPVDDSVARVVAGGTMLLRRARGWAPLPVAAPTGRRVVIAAGGHGKNTVALAAGDRITLSQHVGDLDTPGARGAADDAARTLETLWAASPEVVACDLHPDYASTRWATARGLPVVRVQHHVAHALAALADHAITTEALAVVWDGTGLGPDGTIWGGEFLRVGPDGRWSRAAHLRPFRLPGGDAASREGWRSALGVLHALRGRALTADTDLAPFHAAPATAIRMILAMLDRAVNSPVTTSAGRIFDAVASLLDLAHHAEFEGAAAMEVEFAADRHAGPVTGYPFPLRGDRAPRVVDWAPALEALLADRAGGASAAVCAARFHAGLAAAVVAVARREGLHDVALTGGCFQNAILLEGCVAGLRAAGLTPLPPRRVPPNDGGLALGQAVAACGGGN